MGLLSKVEEEVCKARSLWTCLVADGQGEPIRKGHLGIEDLRQVPGVGVGGPREAHIDVDGSAVLRVRAPQRCADGAAPVASCAQHGRSMAAHYMQVCRQHSGRA